MSKFMMIFSSGIGIPLNELNNDSVAVSTENFTEATEVSDIDTYSLEVVEEQEDLDDDGTHSNRKQDGVEASPNN